MNLDGDAPVEHVLFGPTLKNPVPQIRACIAKARSPPILAKDQGLFYSRQCEA
jgi:hypothetical protein